VLRVLGAVMVAGYLMERRDRQRLTPGGADPVETPLVVAALGLSVAMALAGRREMPGGRLPHSRAVAR
jgi:hypothetical protein